MGSTEGRTPQEQLDYLNGKIHGLENACRAIIEHLASIDDSFDIPGITNDLKTNMTDRITELNNLAGSVKSSPYFQKGIRDSETSLIDF